MAYSGVLHQGSDDTEAASLRRLPQGTVCVNSVPCQCHRNPDVIPFPSSRRCFLTMPWSLIKWYLLLYICCGRLLKSAKLRSSSRSFRYLIMSNNWELRSFRRSLAMDFRMFPARNFTGFPAEKNFDLKSRFWPQTTADTFKKYSGSFQLLLWAVGSVGYSPWPNW